MKYTHHNLLESVCPFESQGGRLGDCPARYAASWSASRLCSSSSCVLGGRGSADSPSLSCLLTAPSFTLLRAYRYAHCTNMIPKYKVQAFDLGVYINIPKKGSAVVDTLSNSAELYIPRVYFLSSKYNTYYKLYGGCLENTYPVLTAFVYKTACTKTDL